MKKKIFLLFFTIVIVNKVNSQKQESDLLLRSTTGIAGASSVISTNNKEYLIQQSTGQTSTIGTFGNNGYNLRQGFIQPNIISKIMDKNVPINLSAIVYPNPFTENISISFDEEIIGAVTISLYDLLGRLVYVNVYAANKNITINLKDYPVANYILKIRANNKQFLKKIIKN